MSVIPVPPDLLAALETEAGRLGRFGTRVLYLLEVGSTNDVAATLAIQGAAEGTVVVAGAQTRGRGRSGRTWFSPPDAGLYVSVVLRPRSGETSRTWPPLITIAAGVGVAEGIRAASGLPVELKWPNDVVIGDRPGARAHERRWRKLAGILAEASATGRELQHVILGFGINVHRAAVPADVAAGASSLEEEAGRAVDRGRVLVEALAGLRTWYDRIAAGEEIAVVTRWLELAPSAHGASVSVEQRQQRYDGTTAGIDASGALRVKIDSRVLVVQSGEVTWL
jgi:BirA family transcriptional regulator, biotin operon repressor / biotin---[acetyl-CoA-carboxylase] ligase